MHKHQEGLGRLHLLLALAASVGLAVLLVPKYQEFVTRTQLTEAYSLAMQSQALLNEFYQVTNRFPNTAEESDRMKTDALLAPKIVRKVIIDHEDPEHEIVIRVHIAGDVIGNGAGEDPVIFMTGNKSPQAGAMVQWQCGAKDIAPDLLPQRCRS